MRTQNAGSTFGEKPYWGINAHLHSLWQAEGGWDEFHASHLIYLANALKIPLLPMGYTAGVQQSLQIRHANTPDGKPEADVLHESAPTFPGIPNYRPVENGQLLSPNAHPYRIVVIDPRPTLMKGLARLYQFDVDQLLPVVDIPLQGSDVLAFDFGQPYNRTLEESMFGLDVDYRQFPPNFQRYHSADQERIAARMVAVLDANVHNVDLETGPFPIRDMTLSAALAELESLREQQK